MATPNKEIQYLKGEALSKRMVKLAGLISEEHAKVKGAWASALEHARNAGEWLLEARKRKGGHGKWGVWQRWLAKEYNIAVRTQRQYIRIARKWDDARIQQARAEGLTIDSIKKFLQVLQGPPPKPLGKVAAKEMERDNNTADIRKEFAEYLRSLDAYEVGILSATLDDVLAVANADLRERVCGHYEGPYYRYRDEYYREQAAAKTKSKSEPNKKLTTSEAAKAGESAARADMRSAKVAKRNAMPIRGNAEPAGPPPRRRVRRSGKRT